MILLVLLLLGIPTEHELIGLDEVYARYGFRGTGQTVAVIDTGIAWDHPLLGDGIGPTYKIVGGYDFAEDDTNPYDDAPKGSHGTHTSGTIAGLDVGVATDANLVSLRVFNDNGEGFFSGIEEALLWVHTNRTAFAHPITTVNISLGSEWNSNTVPDWSTMEDELSALNSDGMFISVSAGNKFTNYNTPGLSYPAASPYVVPVMSVDDDGELSYFSQRHTRAIAAPGRTITSTVPSYFGLASGVASFSGTSMAAAYMSGSAVIVRQAMLAAGQTNITQQQIYDVLYANSVDIFDPLTGELYQRLDVAAAVDAVMIGDDLPGDYNGDGTVDAADYVVWRRDGSVLGYNTWRANFGRLPLAAAGEPESPIDVHGRYDPPIQRHGWYDAPEPATSATLFAAWLCVSYRGRVA